MNNLHDTILHLLRIPWISCGDFVHFDEQGSKRWIEKMNVIFESNSAKGENEGR